MVNVSGSKHLESSINNLIGSAVSEREKSKLESLKQDSRNLGLKLIVLVRSRENMLSLDMVDTPKLQELRAHLCELQRLFQQALGTNMKDDFDPSMFDIIFSNLVERLFTGLIQRPKNEHIESMWKNLLIFFPEFNDKKDDPLIKGTLNLYIDVYHSWKMELNSAKDSVNDDFDSNLQGGIIAYSEAYRGYQKIQGDEPIFRSISFDQYIIFCITLASNQNDGVTNVLKVRKLLGFEEIAIDDLRKFGVGDWGYPGLHDRHPYSGDANFLELWNKFKDL